jgi:hypothetical protein
MASFTVILDGQTLANEPMGLQDTAISIQRNEDLPGLFTTMVSDLEFWGDGYEILYAYYQANDLCKEVSCQIIEDCNDGLNFRGLIYLSDVEFNSYKCIATCSVEDDTVQGRLIRMKDLLVPINSVNGQTVNGQGLSNCASYQFATGTTYGNRFAFKMSELFQYVVSYLTDNTTIFQSDIFTNINYRPQFIQLKCVYAGGAGFPLEMKWIDVYGNNVTRVFIGPALFAVTDNATYARAVATVLNQQVFTNSGGNSYQDIVFPYAARATTDGVDDFVEVYFYHQTTFTEINVLAGASTVTVVSTVDATYGAKNLYTTNTSLIEPSVSMPSISFTQLFMGMNAFFNLSLSFTRVGTQLYLRADTQPYFFSNAQSASISDAKDVMLKTDNPLVFSVLNYSNATLNNASIYYQDAGYASTQCAESDAGTTPYFLIPNDYYNGSIGSPAPIGGLYYGFSVNQENKWILLEENTDLLTTPKTVLNMAHTGTTSSINQQNAIIADPISFTYAGSCIHPFAARNYLFRAPLGLRYAGYFLSNNLPIKIAKSLSFEYPLDRAQFNQISNNPTNYIVVNGTRGWIMSVEHNLKTGMTTFELLTE